MDKEKAWDALMDAARTEAGIREERVRIVGMYGDERRERVTGSRWVYVIECDPDCDVCTGRSIP